MSDISKIISQLEEQAAALDRALTALRQVEGSGESRGAAIESSPSRNVRGGRRRLSPEGRQRIIEATKKRWAAKRAAQGKDANAGTATTGKRKRRKLSAEARKKMAEAQRKRWAKIKGA